MVGIVFSIHHHTFDRDHMMICDGSIFHQSFLFLEFFAIKFIFMVQVAWTGQGGENLILLVLF